MTVVGPFWAQLLDIPRPSPTPDQTSPKQLQIPPPRTLPSPTLPNCTPPPLRGCRGGKSLRLGGGQEGFGATSLKLGESGGSWGGREGRVPIPTSGRLGREVQWSRGLPSICGPKSSHLSDKAKPWRGGKLWEWVPRRLRGESQSSVFPMQFPQLRT